jgi:uncharacterized membrane protein AbrB (regulator of aidB expression)
MIFLPASGAEVLLAGVELVAPAALLLVPLLLGAAAGLELEFELELPHPVATAAIIAASATTINTRFACHALLTVLSSLILVY